MTTKISTANIQTSTLAVLGANPKVSQVIVCDSSYNELDDTAIDLVGGYIKITGSGFKTGASVTVNKSLATSVTFVSSTELRAQIPAQVAGTYVLYVVNTDGSVAIRVNAVTYSSAPTWVTGSDQYGDADTAISIQLVATGAAVFSVAAGSTLPTGLTLTSAGLLIGTITGLESETTFNFTVVATDLENQDSPRTFSIAIAVGDPYWSRVTGLINEKLPAKPLNSGSAGLRNAEFTVTGDTRTSTLSPYLGGNYSCAFDGTGDYLTVPNVSSRYSMGTGDFTVEAWVYMNVMPSTNGYPGSFWITGGGPANSNTGFDIAVGSTNLIVGLTTFASPNISVPHSMVAGTWYHIAVVRSGSTLTAYKDGKVLGTATVTGVTVDPALTGLAIAAAEPSGSTAGNWNGNISNLRIVKGTAVYTSAFTPPLEPLTAVTGTVLLACQSNRLVDTSAEAAVITKNGDIKVSQFVPYTPVQAYGYYGSAQFDGNGDYLTAASASYLELGTGDFTIEFWVYPTTVATAQPWFELYDGSWRLRLFHNATAVVYNPYTPSVISAITGGTVPVNAWSHIALCRASGITKLFINGTQSGSSYVDSIAYPQFGAMLGKDTAGATYSTGNICDLRILSGSAAYTSNFTPPTAPLEDSNSAVLAGLTSTIPYNNKFALDSSTTTTAVSVVGNTTQGSFGPYGESWSGFFDGTNDYLISPTSSELALGSGDFTVELWAYATNAAAAPGTWRTILSIAPSTAAGKEFRISQGQYTYGTLGVMYPDATNSSGIFAENTGYILPRGQWTHIAVARQGTSMKLFANGVLIYTYTVGFDHSVASYVNIANNPFNDLKFDGYISNVRIVKGTALYISAFTPSTQPLDIVGNTVFLACKSAELKDVGPNAFTLTKTGEVNAQKFSPFSNAAATAKYYSTYFDGNGDYLTIPAGNGILLTDSDFTLECWVRPSTTASGTIAQINATSGYARAAIRLMTVDSQLQLLMSTNADTWTMTTGSIGSVPIDTWSHIAVTKSGTTVKVYINGVQVGTDYAVAGSLLNGELNYLGAYNTSPYEYYKGYVSNFRIVKGTVLYTGTFVPSATPLTAVSGTVALTCHTNTLVDASSTQATITGVGNTIPIDFAPFATQYKPKQAYSTAIFGGSTYFDGTGDYLNIAASTSNQLSGSKYTIEMWVYPTTATAERRLLNKYHATLVGYKLYLNTSGVVCFQTDSTNMSTGTGVAAPYSWNHIAVTNDGTTTRIFVNGKLSLSAPGVTITAANETGAVYLGISSAATLPFTGFMSDVRIVKGEALYTSNFQPQYRPLEAVKNTTLLLSGTDGAFYDSVGANVYETSGTNAGIILKPSGGKFGGPAIYLGGTVDGYLVTPAGASNTPDSYLFRHGDFTIEFWISSLAGTGNYIVMANSASGSGITANAANWILTINAGIPRLYVSDGASMVGLFTATTSVTGGSWNHVAVVKSGANIQMYVNGVQEVNSALSGTPAVTLRATYIGGNGTAANRLNGATYLSDIRMSRGFARYTSNFTVPDKVFKNR